MGPYGQRPVDSPLSQYFQTILYIFYDFLFEQHFRGHGIDARELRELGEVDYGILFFERPILESPLGKPPLHRHLAALEPRSLSSAGAGLLPLMAFCRGLPVSGAVSAPDSLRFVSAALCRGKILYLHNLKP